MYVGHNYSADDMIPALIQGGIPVKQCLNARQLHFLRSEDVYLKNGTFDAQRVTQITAELEQQATHEGYQGVCVVGEAAWALRDEETIHKLIDYETTVNQTLKNSRTMALCLYDEHLFSPALLKRILSAHPYLVLYGMLYKNPQFVPSAEMLPYTDGLSESKDYAALIDTIITSAQ